MKKYPKILIIGTLPYRIDATSRAFDSYFLGWPKEKLAQIFSSPLLPLKGHCENLYQITDYRLLKRRLNNKIQVGIKYKYDDLAEQDNQEKSNESQSFIYTKKGKKGPFKKLIRRFIWRKKYWMTKELNAFIDNFDPELIFLSWSDDFFILELGQYVSQRKKIPIISNIGDDYYFNNCFSLSPFYYIYRVSYKKLFKKILKIPGNQIYIDDKIKDKYNNYFNLNGKTIHVCSDIVVKNDFNYKTNIKNYIYFGNLGYNRYKTIIEFANSLIHHNINGTINIFSSLNNKAIIKKLKKCKNINFYGKIKYKEINDQVDKNDAILIIESLTNKQSIKDVEYSLSTKVGDSLSYGKIIIGIGNERCGAISFLLRERCAIVLSSKKEINEYCINKIDVGFLKDLENNAKKLLQYDFNKEYNIELFHKIALDLTKNHL